MKRFFGLLFSLCLLTLILSALRLPNQLTQIGSPHHFEGGDCLQCHQSSPTWHDQDFLLKHGEKSYRPQAKCQACHSESSCLACHSQRPKTHHTNYIYRHGDQNLSHKTCLQCHQMKLGRDCSSCHSAQEFMNWKKEASCPSH